MSASLVTRISTRVQRQASKNIARVVAGSTAQYSAKEENHSASKDKIQKTTSPSSSSKNDASQKRKKTLAEMDEELRLAMEGHAGDGGIAGAELEEGKAVGLKRSVKTNMFRYI